MKYQDIITIEPGKRGGKPCIRGLRITVYDVLEYLASGMSEDQIIADFPDLDKTDIRACLTFAADRERRLISLPDPLFHAAESIAKRMGLSRSELFQRALQTFLDENKDAGVTEELNLVYAHGSEDRPMDPLLEQLQLISLPKDEWS